MLTIPDLDLSHLICDEEELPNVMAKHSESFIGQRSVKEVTGPIAVFGRHGISLTMTRSIGDRLDFNYILI